MSDYRYDRIKNHIEGCLRQVAVFERGVEGSSLIDFAIVNKSGSKWLTLAAGVSDKEARSWFSDGKRDRATTPLRVVPEGEARSFLVMRPVDGLSAGKDVVEFSADVPFVALHQGCYVRVDELTNPTVRQIRWEFEPADAHKSPIEDWLRPWSKSVGCNPAHAPSHWHINSPLRESSGPRRGRQHESSPELRLATGLPNPLLLLLSLANWLRLSATMG